MNELRGFGLNSLCGLDGCRHGHCEQTNKHVRGPKKKETSTKRVCSLLFLFYYYCCCYYVGYFCIIHVKLPLMEKEMEENAGF